MLVACASGLAAIDFLLRRTGRTFLPFVMLASLWVRWFSASLFTALGGVNMQVQKDSPAIVPGESFRTGCRSRCYAGRGGSDQQPDGKSNGRRAGRRR